MYQATPKTQALIDAFRTSFTPERLGLQCTRDALVSVARAIKCEYRGMKKRDLVVEIVASIDSDTLWAEMLAEDGF